MKRNLQLFSLALLFLSSCATPPTKETPEFGPQPETPATSAESLPKPFLLGNKKVVLVFGGAGVASFATVGILKEFVRQEIPIERIVTTGWPTLFALGFANFKSVHDLEWFASKLDKSDFFGNKLFNFNKGFSSHESLEALMEKSFSAGRRFSDLRIPLTIVTTDISEGKTKLFASGEWKAPALGAFSVPGLFRPFSDGASHQWISSPFGVDVDPVANREDKIIVAVEMYTDYLGSLEKNGPQDRESLFQKLYVENQRAQLREQLDKAHIQGSIALYRSPTQFNSVRQAILKGELDAKKWIAQLKSGLRQED